MVLGRVDPASFHPDLAWLEQELSQPKPPKLVVITNPCNPTGLRMAWRFWLGPPSVSWGLPTEHCISLQRVGLNFTRFASWDAPSCLSPSSLLTTICSSQPASYPQPLLPPPQVCSCLGRSWSEPVSCAGGRDPGCCWTIPTSTLCMADGCTTVLLRPMCSTCFHSPRCVASIWCSAGGVGAGTKWVAWMRKGSEHACLPLSVANQRQLPACEQQGPVLVSKCKWLCGRQGLVDALLGVVSACQRCWVWCCRHMA